MGIVHDLQGRIRGLVRLDIAGRLEDYQIAVAEATRGPRGDLERYPHFKFDVGRFARLASTLFAVPIGEAHEAACEALLPSTRRGVAFEILEEFEQQLDDECELQRADQKLRAAGRRRVGA